MFPQRIKKLQYGGPGTRNPQIIVLHFDSKQMVRRRPGITLCDVSWVDPATLTLFICSLNLSILFVVVPGLHQKTALYLLFTCFLLKVAVFHYQIDIGLILATFTVLQFGWELTPPSELYNLS